MSLRQTLIQILGRPFYLIAFVALSTTACKETDSASKANNVYTPLTPTPTGTLEAIPDPIYFDVKISTLWDGAPTKSTTEVRKLHTTENDSIGRMKYFQVSIPEGQLYYSKLIFTVSVGPESACQRYQFTPYSYLASNSASFDPPWDNFAPVNCSGVTKDKRCYNGAAKRIISDFPKRTSLFYAVSSKRKAVFTIPSPYSYGRNPIRSVANDLNLYDEQGNLNSEHEALRNNGFVSVADGESFVGGTYQDYQFECFDQYDDLLWGMVVSIDDDNFDPTYQGGDPNLNDFEDWKDILMRLNILP